MAKYSKSAGDKVKTVMKEMNKGKLKSGSGQKVTNRKQAIAIGLSEARAKGAKVPVKEGATKNAVPKKSSSKNAALKNSSIKNAAPQRPGAKKAAPKKTATGRSTNQRLSSEKFASKKSAPKKSSATAKATGNRSTTGKPLVKETPPNKSATKKSHAKSSAPKKTASVSPPRRKGTMIRRATPVAKPVPPVKRSTKGRNLNLENKNTESAPGVTNQPENDSTNTGNNNFSNTPVEENNNTAAGVEEPVPHNAVKTEMIDNPISDSRSGGDNLHEHKNPAGAKGRTKPGGKKPL